MGGGCAIHFPRGMFKPIKVVKKGKNSNKKTNHIALDMINREHVRSMKTLYRMGLK